MPLVKRYRLFFAAFAILAGSVWLFYAATAIALPTLSRPIIFFSNHTRDDLHLLFRKAFEQAKQEIVLHMYAMSDPILLQIIEQKQKSGIKVKLFYDPSSCGVLSYPFAYPIYANGLMHRKIAVIDSSLVLVGTANLTSQSLHFHDNLVVGMRNTPLAQFFSDCSVVYKKFESGECWLLPDRDNKALHRLLQLIQTSKTSIRIAMFTLTHPQLIDALLAAKQRGVQVACAVDFYTSQGASAQAISKLEQAGIQLYRSQGKQLLHHKWAWIDEKIFIVGSANWTRAAFEKNQDCFIIFDDIPLKEKKTLQKIWHTIVMEAKF